MANRYALPQLEELLQSLVSTASALQPQLTNLIRESEFTCAAGPLDERKREVAVPIQMEIANPAASNVGRLLVDVDLELRRSSALLTRNATAPTRNVQLVRVLTMRADDSLRLALGASGELHDALTSRPIEFLATLDWLWDNRFARSRVRSPSITSDPSKRWAGILTSAFACTATRRPVVTTMVVEHDGSTTFAFRLVEMGP